jgi:hypothetical protein
MAEASNEIEHFVLKEEIGRRLILLRVFRSLKKNRFSSFKTKECAVAVVNYRFILYK